MTPEQVALVRSTVAAVEERCDEFARSFHEALFEQAPATRALFPADLANARAELVAEISILGAAVSDVPGFVARGRALGARHHGMGVRRHHYAAAEHAMLSALENVLGPQWTPSTMLAWQRLYCLIAETMLEGAASEAVVGDPGGPGGPPTRCCAAGEW